MLRAMHVYTESRTERKLLNVMTVLYGVWRRRWRHEFHVYTLCVGKQIRVEDFIRQFMCIQMYYGWIYMEFGSRKQPHNYDNKF